MATADLATEVHLTSILLSGLGVNHRHQTHIVDRVRIDEALIVTCPALQDARNYHVPWDDLA